MFGSVLSVIGNLQAILSLATFAFVLISAWRSRRTAAEDDDRALMRSMSWPTTR